MVWRNSMLALAATMVLCGVAQSATITIHAYNVDGSAVGAAKIEITHTYYQTGGLTSPVTGKGGPWPYAIGTSSVHPTNPTLTVVLKRISNPAHAVTLVLHANMNSTVRVIVPGPIETMRETEAVVVEECTPCYSTCVPVQPRRGLFRCFQRR
jgi:hypothetical protein